MCVCVCVCVVAEKEFLILREDRQTDTRSMFHDVVVQLVAEKEFLIAMLTTSHDLHLLRIDTREDALVRRSSDWVGALIDDMHERVEMRRNRERITEICHFVDHLRDQVDEIEDQVTVINDDNKRRLGLASPW